MYLIKTLRPFLIYTVLIVVNRSGLIQLIVQSVIII
jgi:hypothetical protein